MNQTRYLLRESFWPLLVVLLLIIGLSFFVDRRAERVSERVTVIKLRPDSERWDLGVTDDDALREGAEEIDLPPDGEDPDRAAVRAWLERGDLEQAARALELLLTHRAEDPWLLNAMGVVELKRQAPAQALAWLDRALARDDGFVHARFNHAIASARLGRAAEAAADYRQVLALRPKHFKATYNLGLLHLEAGEDEAALELLASATALAGGARRGRAYFSYGVALARLGRRDEADKAYQRAIEYKPDYLLPRYNQALLALDGGGAAGRAKAAELLEVVLRLQPDFAPAYFLRGRLASVAGDDRAALRWYETAARYAPGFWKARYNQGIVALRLGLTDLAQQVFARLAADFPSRPEASFNLGRIAYQREDLELALQRYREAIQLRGGAYPEAELNLALVLQARGDHAQALEVLDKLLDADPGNARALLNRGLTLKRLGRGGEARLAMEQAVKVEPGYALAHFNLGKLFADLDRYAEAVAAYTRALEADPGQLKAAVNLGICHAKAGDLEAAVRAYRQAIAIAPDYAPAYYNLGLTLRKLGRLPDAVLAYQKVVELDEEHLSARQNLGVLYAKLGQHELAARTFGELLDREPTRAGARFNLALQYEKLGQVARAELELGRLIRLQPDAARAYTGLARLYNDQRRYPETIALLERRPRLTARQADLLEAARAGLGTASKPPARPPASAL